MGAGGSTNNMGNNDSKESVDTPTGAKVENLKKASEDAIDPRIAKYLVDRLQSQDREKSFMRIILKLPKIGEKFVKLQKAFEMFDKNSDGVIDEDELLEALKVLGAKATKEQALQVFSSADVHSQKGLRLKEFIISLSHAYLFGVIPVGEDGSLAISAMTKTDQEGIREAFAAAADMFLLFDEDAGGTISLDEVVSVMGRMGQSNVAKKSTKKFSTGNNLSSMYIQRFKEFDWDSDGTITFSEFLFAFIGWTDIDDLVEEEAAEAAEAKAAEGGGGAGAGGGGSAEGKADGGEAAKPAAEPAPAASTDAAGK